MPSFTYLTRVIRFSAAHRYHRDEWSDERNREVFGACNNPHGHGHNYVLEVTTAAEPDWETGFSVDLGVLDRLLTEIRAELDHQHLNHALPDFGPGGKVPTTENLVIWLWKRMEGRLPSGVRLFRLRLREDVDLWVDYYGPTVGEGEIRGFTV